jgi:phosphate transport system substrate-binding protein
MLEDFLPMLRRLCAFVALALSLAACAAQAFQEEPGTLPVIYGGGSMLPFYDYTSEISTFNATATKATVTPYLANVTSSVAIEGILRDDFTCVSNASSGANGGNCSGTCIQPDCMPGPIPDDYAANDLALTSAQIATWAVSAVGQPTAGNLIQIPSMGYGVAIPVVNSAVATNGAVTLSDGDLCGIFSGLITDFSQITDAGTLTPGPITVAYRSDSAGITLTLTYHLNGVCTSANSAITFQGVENFATLFSLNNVAIPGNFIGLTESAGIANYLAGLSGTAVTSAIGYLTPDYTSLVTSPVTLSNALPSPLLVAGVYQGRAKELPTAAAIETALAHPKMGVSLTPPTTEVEGANPAAWFPLIQTTSKGYPIVGYTAFDFAQCYRDKGVSKGIVAFLKAHYGTGSPKTTQIDSGFAQVESSFRTAIKNHILANTNTGTGVWNDNIGNPTACYELFGR